MATRAVINWDTKKVTNLIEVSPDVASTLIFPEGFTTRDATNVPVVIGDEWDEDNGCYLRDGFPIERELSEKERIEALEAMLAALAGGAE